MDISKAIDKLSEFKKIADAGIGECELVDFDEDSFVVKVNFRNDRPERKPILGFADGTERKPRKRKGIIEA